VIDFILALLAAFQVFFRSAGILLWRTSLSDSKSLFSNENTRNPG
jgi:hypothetical protein